MEKHILRKEILYVEFELFDKEGKSREVANDLREEFLNDFQKGFNNFWVNVSKITGMGSSLTGVIAFMGDTIKNRGKVVISGLDAKSREVFSITNLDCMKDVELIEIKDAPGHRDRSPAI